MSEERKKAQPKPVVKVEPKKRAEPKAAIKVEPKKRVEEKVVEKVKPVVEKQKTVKPPLKKPEVKKNVEPEVKKIIEPKIVLDTNDTTEVKLKRAENKYVRIALDAKTEERSEISTKVKNGEIKYAYYATDSDKGYHYYIVLKK